MKENEIATIIVDCAVKLHRQAGPGMLERVYHSCLSHLLRKRGLTVEEEKWIAFEFEDLKFERAYRIDILVESKVVVEIKSVAAITESHVSQTITYLRCTKTKLGLILNFGAPTMKAGLKRVIDGNLE